MRVKVFVLLLISAFLLNALCGCGASNAKVVFEKPWGSVAFENGNLCSLNLSNGSNENLWTPASQGQITGVYCTVQGKTFFSADDQAEVQKTDDNHLKVSGQLHDVQGRVINPAINYEIIWEISESGYIKMNSTLSSKTQIEGDVSYRFAFNEEKLNRYYYSGFKPEFVRTTTSLMNVPMDEIPAATDTVFHFDDYALGRYFGFVRSETEMLNFVIDQGYIEDVSLLNGEACSIVYSDSTPSTFDNIRASFYILPAPVRQLKKLNRMYTSTVGPKVVAGTTEAFVDTLAKYGFKEYLYHNWKLWNKKDPNQGHLTFIPADPEGLKELISVAHARDIRVILYLNLLPEDKKTIWYQNNDAGQWATEHPFSLDMTGKTSAVRDVMDLNSPYFEHRIADADNMLDNLGADGVYIDWFTMIGCSDLHPYHEELPATNISKLIAFIDHVKSKGKLIYIHSGEESRIPFLEEYSGVVICGERGWNRVDYASTESGVFDRWTTSAGHFSPIFDSRYAYSEAENRLEVNAAILEGLNPFGYVYRTQFYGRPKVKAPKYADQYLFDLLLALKPYDIESMTLYPDKAEAAHSDEASVGVTVLSQARQQLLFVVNRDMKKTAAAKIRLNPDIINIDAKAVYRVKNLNLSTAENLSGEQLLTAGFPLRVAANDCVIIAIEAEE